MKKIGLATLFVLLVAIPLVYGQNTLVKKLKASPDDFVGKDVVLQCRFYKLQTNFLNGAGARYSPPPGERIYFPSTEYLGFEICAPTDNIFLDFLFIKKNKGEILYELNMCYVKIICAHVGNDLWTWSYRIHR